MFAFLRRNVSGLKDSMIPVRTDADIEALLAASDDEPVVLLKHSSTCPVSLRGQMAVLALAAPDDPPLYRVVVQEARAASNALAERLGVRHESPQAILLFRRTVQAVFNHFDVRTEALRAAARDLTA